MAPETCCGYLARIDDKFAVGAVIILKGRTVFVPIYDENRLKVIKFQYFTVFLIAANIVVFLLEASGVQHHAVASFAVIPSQLVQVGFWGGPAISASDVASIPEQYTLISYMFFHGSALHLAGNMLFLWVFGDNVEDAMGHIRFFGFYILCGVIAGLVHTLVMPDSTKPLIGASGAVAGVIAAYLILHPRVNVWVLAFRYIPLRISAALALGSWIAIQIVMVLLPQNGPVAWWAHIGGFAAGAILVVFLRRRNVPLLERGLTT